MNTFASLNLSTPLRNAIDDLEFVKPTPIQAAAFSVILSGKDIVGIAQTGTGKTLAYMLPILQNFKFSKEIDPNILILVPTRELVLQVVEQIESFAKYINVRVVGVYGGANINKQKDAVAIGADIIVATPGRLYDLALSRSLKLRRIKQLVIDEVDVMLDLGFRFQLTNIMELLKERRQNIMFSATMTEDVDILIDDFFRQPTKISIALSGTPLDNIAQQCYKVPNFFTKINLLNHLLSDESEYSKVLVFVAIKKHADRLFDELGQTYGAKLGIIHSNKSQNFRERAVQQFQDGTIRILIATDVMARGLDLDKITHVINFDTPAYPENYMHRIGRTGRAEQEGKSILFYTKNEVLAKESIEKLMSYKIPIIDFPNEVGISTELIPEEQSNYKEHFNRNIKKNTSDKGASFHEKKDKNKKVNQGGSYRRELALKYKKPKTRGDKNANRKKR